MNDVYYSTIAITSLGHMEKLEMETETGNVCAHCDIDLAGGPLSKEKLCLSTAERSIYIASCPGVRIASLVPRHTDK